MAFIMTFTGEKRASFEQWPGPPTDPGTCDFRPLRGMARRVGARIGWAGCHDRPPEELAGGRAMASRTPSTRFLRVLLTLPAIVAGAVVALHLLLFGWGMLMRVRWISDQTRQLTKRGNRYLR
jgi:hypothetical protein